MDSSTGAYDVYLPQASANADEFDALFFALMGISSFIVVLLLVLGVVFVTRYRYTAHASRRAGAPEREAEEFELGWTVIPLLVFLGLFAWAAAQYLEQQRPPDDAMVIHVIAKQWMWKFRHPGGQREIDELHLPKGRAVKLVMTSQDVIHSFYVPAFRMKQDVVPGRYTTLWFTPVRTGRYRLFCAEYCGTSHSRMGGGVVVLEPDRFEAWLARNDTGETLAAQGRDLFMSLGCSGCHAPASSVHAPRLAGLYGQPVALADGGVVTADDAYLRDSILLPESQVVAGFAPIMPSFDGRIDEDAIVRLIAYIQSLGNDAPINMETSR